MDNQKMLQAMFVEATLGIIVVNAKGEIVQANPFSEKLFGYEKGELISKKIEILLPDSFRSRHVKHRQNYHKNPIPRTMGANLELYGVRKDGSQFPIEISLSHMDIDGERFAIAYAKDRKEDLVEAQKLAHVGSFEIDLKTEEMKMSEEMRNIFGLDISQEVFNYHDVVRQIHPDDQQTVLDFHRKMLAEKKGYDFGYRILSKTRGLRYLEGKRNVKFNSNGNVAKIFGMVQDVTDLKEAQKISEDISKIVEESLNEIFIFDAETLKFVQVNKGALQNIGYSLEEMQSMTPIDIKPNFEEAPFLELLVPLKNGETDKLLFETVHERKDKSTYLVEVHLQYSKLGNQSVYVAIILDITERKKNEKKILEYSNDLEQKVMNRTKALKSSEAKLRVSLEKEKELGELKSRFVSMASHEFRTPLSSILSSANLIGRYEEGGEQQAKRMKHVGRIESSVRNLTMILNDFLSLEKLESGKIRYNPVDFEIENFVQLLVEEVNLTAKGEQKVVHHHEGNNMINADEHLLKNILINLLSNGIKYSTEGQNVELHTKNNDGNLFIQVRDYGIGIPEAEQKNMFTRFFRANNVTNIQGTGLGLTIVTRYLELMDGKIWFESKQGEGTSFFVEIPKKEI